MDVIEGILGIGVEPKDLTITHVCVRGVVIFLYCIFLVRIGDKRFLSRKSALDAVLGFILASMMARAVNGSAPFVATLVGGAVLVLLHRLIAHLAVRWHFVGKWVKGRSDLVIENGEVRLAELRRNSFSEADMLEDLRLRGVDTPKDVRAAFVERNGQLSVIKQ